MTGDCLVCGVPTRAKGGICARTRPCRRARDFRRRRPDLNGELPPPPAKTPCAICGEPTTSKYGICSRTPQCAQAMHVRRYAEPGRKERMKATDLVWSRANRERVEGYRQNRRARIRAMHVAWRDANPTFIRDWFEADPSQWDGYLQRWAAANHDHARKLRQQAARFSRSSGEQVTLEPALARLELDGREPLYGMAGAYWPRPVPWPGGSVIRISWQSHAEGECFARAVMLGHRGGKGTLTLTHDPCNFCAASFAGYARLLGLSSLTVWAADELFGSCHDGGRFSRPTRGRRVPAAPA